MSSHSCVCRHVDMVYMWSSVDLQELALFFYHVDAVDGTQDIRFDNKHLYSLSHLTCPRHLFFREESNLILQLEILL